MVRRHNLTVEKTRVATGTPASQSAHYGQGFRVHTRYARSERLNVRVSWK